MAKGSGSVLLFGAVAAALGVIVLSKSSAASPASPGGTGGMNPGGPQLPAGCQLDANLPPALAQQIVAALNTPGTPASTFAQLASFAQQGNYPLAAACLAQSAAKTAAKPAGPLTGFRLSPAILGAVAKSVGVSKSPVDWTASDTNMLNQIASLRSQGFSSADALTIYSYMTQGGMTFPQAVTSLLQYQGITGAQTTQILGLLQQGTPFTQAVAQTQPSL